MVLTIVILSVLLWVSIGSHVMRLMNHMWGSKCSTSDILFGVIWPVMLLAAGLELLVASRRKKKEEKLRKERELEELLIKMRELLIEYDGTVEMHEEQNGRCNCLAASPDRLLGSICLFCGEFV